MQCLQISDATHLLPILHRNKHWLIKMCLNLIVACSFFYHRQIEPNYWTFILLILMFVNGNLAAMTGAGISTNDATTTAPTQIKCLACGLSFIDPVNDQVTHFISGGFLNY